MEAGHGREGVCVWLGGGGVPGVGVDVACLWMQKKVIWALGATLCSGIPNEDHPAERQP